MALTTLFFIYLFIIYIGCSGMQKLHMGHLFVITVIWRYLFIYFFSDLTWDYVIYEMICPDHASDILLNRLDGVVNWKRPDDVR